MSPGPAIVPAPFEVDALGSLELVDFAVAGDHAIAGSAVRELGLPRSALIAVVARPATTRFRRAAAPSSSPATASSSSSPRKKRADLEDVFSRWRRRV